MYPFTREKLQKRVPQILAAAVRDARPLDGIATVAAPGSADQSAMAPAPAVDAAWRPLTAGEVWGVAPGAAGAAPPRDIGWGIPENGGSTHWLRATMEVPSEWRGRQVLLAMEWAGAGQASQEAILYLDGSALAGVDEFHRAVLLPAEAHQGQHEVLLRVYVPYPLPFGGLRLLLRDEHIWRLGITMRALLEAAETYRESDVAGHRLFAAVNDAYTLLDLRSGWQSDAFASSAREALAVLERTIAELPPAAGPVLLSTGHAHLDTAWLWPLWRTHQKVAHTAATALHLMERYGDYHFSMSQPQVYEYLRQDDPELYERVKACVADGRFEPVGMMWIEADCNVPSGEALVRQMKDGARWFEAQFGSSPLNVWLPDVFGYSAALPQIMRLCGVPVFMTTKISWSQFNRMPHDTFRWRGIDGSEVLTHFVTATSAPLKHPAEAQFYTYVGHMTGAEVFGTWNHYREKQLTDELLYIYGWGDGGGGPTEEMLEAMQVFRRLPNCPRPQPGRAGEFLQRLYERVWDDPRLATWVGELYLEYHRGTYTSQSRTKQANRRAELQLREAEWLNAWSVLQGGPDCQAELDAAWRLVLLNQFHDILPGSGVRLVYADSNAQFEEVSRATHEVAEQAAKLLGRAEDGGRRAEESFALRPPSSVLIWNSLPWERRELVALPADAGADGIVQQVQELDGSRAVLVEATAPSLGFTRVQRGGEDVGDAGPTALPGRPELRVERRLLANSELRVELDSNGEIASLTDLRYGREVALGGQTLNQLVAFEDRPLNWEAWDIDIFYEEKPYPVREIVDWRIVEQGPLRAAIEIVRRVGDSTIRQQLRLHRGSRRLDFVTEVDWQERQTLLKALFPLDVNTPHATCEIQFGAVERPTHRNTSWDVARFEVCAHRWVDLSEDGYGVALLNDGKYGHSFRDTTVGLSLLKGGIFPDPDADRGTHRFTYSLLPHRGDWREAQVTRRAYELNAPLRARPAAEGSPDSGSFLSCSAEHVVVETVKTADNGDGTIVRLYEAHNRRGPVELRFGRTVASAVEVDLRERERGPATIARDTLRCEVRPFEIKSFRVRFGG